MSINKNNYELYLVDYSEGKLSEETANEVVRFLMANPEIKEEFELFTDSKIQTNKIPFGNKESLKNIPYESSSANSEFFQQQCVAKLEHQLSANEEERFNNAVLAEKDKLKEFNLFAKTKLTAENIIFNEKLTLKQSFTSHVINPDNFIEYCVACSEGWLNHQGAIALNEYIAKNTELKKEYDLISQIKFTPDYSIEFPNKTSLKKFQIFGAQTKKYFSYAASLVAVLALSFFVYKTPTLLNNVQTANTNQAVSTKAVETTKTIKQNKQIILANALDIKPKQTRKTKNEALTSNPVSENKRTLHVESIKPKTINYIECQKCTATEKTINTPNLTGKKTKLASNEQKRKLENFNSKSLASSLVQAGISGISKISRGKVKVKNQEGQNKTKISFSSKYLAFSTNVKSNKHN